MLSTGEATQPHSHAMSQPQPQMASTPLTALNKGHVSTQHDINTQQQALDSGQFRNNQSNRHQERQQFQNSNETSQRQQGLSQPVQNPYNAFQHTQPQRQSDSRQGDLVYEQRQEHPPYTHHKQDSKIRDGRNRQDLVGDRYRADSDMVYSNQKSTMWPEKDRRNPDSRFPPHQNNDNFKSKQQQQLSQSYPQNSSMRPQNVPSDPPSYHRDIPGHPNPSSNTNSHAKDRPMGSRSRTPQNLQEKQSPHARGHESQLHSGHPNVSNSLKNDNFGSSQYNQVPSQIRKPGFQQTGPSQQPIRLLDAPGVHRYSDNRGVTSDVGPGAPRHQQQRKEEPTIQQQRPRSRGENMYEDMSVSVERDQRSGQRTGRTTSTGPPHGSQVPPGPPPNTQSIQGFRAYPPPASQGGQNLAPWRIIGADEPRRDVRNMGGYHPPPAPTPRGNYGKFPAQDRGAHSKRFQEQEWRQTYLDDSDTL